MFSPIELLVSEVNNAGFANEKLMSLSRSEILVLPSAAMRDETGKSRNLYTPVPACENADNEVIMKIKTIRNFLFIRICIEDLLKWRININPYFQKTVKDTFFLETELLKI
jgi:hypothetical protein